jgi:predicted phage terminase large subunit-like protein
MNLDKLTYEEQGELLDLYKQEEIFTARTNLWAFCKLLAPDFYKDSRPHLRDLCDALQWLYQGESQLDGEVYKNLMINLPPQFGKTRTMTMWCMWVLGQSNQERFVLGSYSDTPAVDMSRAIRDGIDEKKNIDSDVVYSDIFPDTKLKYGDSSVKRWALEGEFFNFLADGIIGGGVTGKGATIQIYDDLIKGREESLSEAHKEKVWGSYSSTWSSRKDASVQEPLKVMIATRWAEDDPCGKELDLNPDDWYVITMPAFNEDTYEMLCDDFLSYEAYEKKLVTSQDNPIEEQIFLANYQQETIDVKGLLYKPFKTYTDLPDGQRKNKTDTADKGEDYLCSICYTEDVQGYCYVTDILYTQDHMEETEPLVAKMLIDNHTGESEIESNNGGGGFARNVNKLTPEKINVWSRHQSANKQVRIFSNSATVNRMILFPVGWNKKYPEFYKHLTKYKIKFSANKHDDAPDTLTAIIEGSSNDFLEVDVY